MRLIDADALTMVTEFIDGKKHEYYEKFEIDDAPTIEAEPIRHGHWIIDNKKPWKWQCSYCHCWVFPYDFIWFPYCGAKMDKEKEGVNFE